MTQGTAASMPALVFSLLGGLPGIQCTAASNQVLSTPNITQAQPFAYIGVAQRPTAVDAGAIFATLGVSFIEVSGSVAGTANNWTIYETSGNTSTPTTVLDSAFHAALGQFNTTTALYIDGSSAASGSLGTTGLSANAFRVCRGNATHSGSPKIMEVGVWPADETANAAAISANQHSATVGYNF